MKEKKEKSLVALYFKVLFIVLAILAVWGGVAYGIFHYLVGGLNRSEVDEKNLSVNEEVVKQSKEQKIMNIALYGVDSRNQDYKGRSDAIILLSLNGNTGKIKLVSIARDSYVSVPGHYDTKINHAYAYGGPELAIQTLNENFGLDVSDYVTVNFDSLADIIDEMGGIDLEVSEAERQQINAYLLRGEPLRQTGMVHLNGPQAVSYSRIRKIDSDSKRAERQRRVLTCLFEKALEIKPMQYPTYIRKFAPMAETSLSNEELLQIASIGMKGSQLKLEQAAFPNDFLPYHGETIAGVWYYVYDTDVAADMLHQYIYEDVPFEEYVQPENITKRRKYSPAPEPVRAAEPEETEEPGETGEPAEGQTEPVEGIPHIPEWVTPPELAEPSAPEEPSAPTQPQEPEPTEPVEPIEPEPVAEPEPIPESEPEPLPMEPTWVTELTGEG